MTISAILQLNREFYSVISRGLTHIKRANDRNKKSHMKKTIPRSKWITLRGLRTNQILMSAFYFLQILTKYVKNVILTERIQPGSNN